MRQSRTPARPKPLAAKVIDADTALLAVLDVWDSARLKVLTALATLHEHLEVQRVSGGLDAHAFSNALQSFDPSLNQHEAIAVYIDCELGANEERERAGGKDVRALAAAASEGIPRAVFLRVCEEHGVRKPEVEDN